MRRREWSGHWSLVLAIGQLSTTWLNDQIAGVLPSESSPNPSPLVPPCPLTVTLPFRPLPLSLVSLFFHLSSSRRPPFLRCLYFVALSLFLQGLPVTRYPALFHRLRYPNHHSHSLDTFCCVPLSDPFFPSRNPDAITTKSSAHHTICNHIQSFSMKSFALAAAIGAASTMASSLPVALDHVLSPRASSLPEVVVKGNGTWWRCACV